MEAELRASRPEASVRLVAGSGGVFEVRCDGRLIFSKKETPERRFPVEGEIARLIG